MKLEYLEYLLFNKFAVYMKNSNSYAKNEQIVAILYFFHSLEFFR